MTMYSAGEVVLIAFPYASSAQAKRRPALVILDTGDDDVVVARVTTQSRQTPHDVLLISWQAAGLRAPSTIRLHKLATVEKTLVTGRLGSLSPSDRQAVSAVMRQVYGAW